MIGAPFGRIDGGIQMPKGFFGSLPSKARPLLRFATVGMLFGATPLAASPICHPTLTVKEVSFSSVINLRRYWNAAIWVDASRCAKRTGLFALKFMRGAENAPELEFFEPFIWNAGETTVRVEFWADETVERYWLADVAPCPCRGE